jgi:glycosyltransferase involved in cell wall biosynthesis
MQKANIMISVIIPNYNHGKYLEQRIESILNQTYQNFEIILLDDCSQDYSKEVIEKYKENEKISHIYYADENSGSPFGLWKIGIELAKGKYIWIAESDDWCEITFLENVVKVISKTKASVVHTQSMLYYNNQYKINSWWNSFKSTRWHTDFVEDGKVIINDFGRFKCPVINVSSAVFNKELVKDNFFPEAYRYCGDWYFWVNMFMAGRVAFIAQALNIIRVHNESATSASKSVLFDKLKENMKVIHYTNNLLGVNATYNEKYAWFIDMWLKQFKTKKDIIQFSNYQLDLPIDFKMALFISLAKFLTGRIWTRYIVSLVNEK